MVGSLFCFGIGGLVDRHGSRIVLTALSVALGAVVVGLSSVQSAGMLLVLITLTRGLGQSALSVVSLAMPGKWFRRRLTWAMGVYSLVMSIGFMVAFPTVGAIVQARGWRTAWASVGVALIVGAGAAVVACWCSRTLTRTRNSRCRRDVPASDATDATLAKRCARRRSGCSASPARCTGWPRRASVSSTSRSSPSAASPRTPTTRRWPSRPSRAWPATSWRGPGRIAARCVACWWPR